MTRIPDVSERMDLDGGSTSYLPPEALQELRTSTDALLAAEPGVKPGQPPGVIQEPGVKAGQQPGVIQKPGVIQEPGVKAGQEPGVKQPGVIQEPGVKAGQKPGVKP